MKLHTMVLTAILISAVPAFGSEICVSRKENNGVINIRAAQIIVNNKHIFSVIGGEEKCMEAKAGKHVIYAQSSNPFDPYDKNQKSWKSKPLNILIDSKKAVHIEVSPISRGPEYIGPWNVKEIKK